MKVLNISLISLAALIPHPTYGQVLPTTGLEFLDDSAYQSIPLAATPLLGDLPPATDLSSSFPTPGNQGDQASCVGWATAYAFKSFQEHQERKWPLSNESNQFSPAYIYNQINRSPGCKGGTTFVDALNLLRREGVAPLARFPYREGDCSRKPDAAEKQSAKPFSIADWRRVNIQDEVEVKTNIASGFPVLIGMAVDEGFARLSGTQIYSSRSGAPLGGHAMVVTGYDDTRSAYKVINSWGTQWGDRGFGWISYTAFRQTVREGYVAQDIVVVPPPLPPSPPPPITDDRPVVVPPPLPPPPQPPSAAIGMPAHFHNLSVPSPSGAVPGMRISVPISILNAKGKTAQIVIKFSYLNGPPLYANQLEPSFRDIGGLVATGTPPRVVGTDNESIGDQQITIPYYALNFQPTNGFATYSLAFIVVVYVDNQLVAQSAPTPFAIRW